MVHGHFKDLVKRTASDKVLRDKAFNIAKTQNMMDIKEVLLLEDLFDKKSTSLADKSARGSGANNEIKQNEQLAEELHKPIIKKLKREEFVLHLNTIFGVLI